MAPNEETSPNEGASSKQDAGPSGDADPNDDHRANDAPSANDDASSNEDASPDADPDAAGLHRVARADELAEGDRIIAEIEGREVAVFNANGDLHALSNYCPHQGGPACEGLLSGTLEVDEADDLVWDCDGEIVACPWHGWEFDVTDGKHTASDRYRLPTYDVRVLDGEIYVGL